MTMPSIGRDFFQFALKDNESARPIVAESLIRERCPGLTIVPTGDLDVERYPEPGHCTLELLQEPLPEMLRFWGGEDYDQLYWRYNQVVWRVDWNGHELMAADMHWETGCGGESRVWVIAESAEIADQFILDVERKTHNPGKAILVFSGGRWSRNVALFEATEKASFDDLVLADGLKEKLRNDFRQFLESQDRYDSLGIAWKRGALLIGPPGNGKTHCVRALIKALNIPCLYVQSLSHQYFTSQQMWQQVFKKARGMTPCVLVLEDLDSLVDDENRSFFLNQLDGLEKNNGLMVLATTNHPERIDTAIIDRPSRFDRKYHFELPGHDQRVEYLSLWQARLGEETGWAVDAVDSIAAATKEFSFAYLKELVASTLMQWMEQSDERFEEQMLQQAEQLKEQMKTESKKRPPKKRGHARRPRR